MSDQTMTEESTSYRTILIIVAAIVIACAVVGGYVWVNWEPTPYTGQVVSVKLYPIHHDITQPTTTQGVGGQTETYDEMLVFADVRIKNVAKSPLYVQDMWAVADLPNESDRSDAASESDFEKVFIAYPETKPFQQAALRRDTKIQPGQQIEAEMIFNYQLSQAQWNSRTGMEINIGFLHHGPLVLHVSK